MEKKKKLLKGENLFEENNFFKSNGEGYGHGLIALGKAQHGLVLIVLLFNYFLGFEKNNSATHMSVVGTPSATGTGMASLYYIITHFVIIYITKCVIISPFKKPSARKSFAPLLNAHPPKAIMSSKSSPLLVVFQPLGSLKILKSSLKEGRVGM